LRRDELCKAKNLIYLLARVKIYCWCWRKSVFISVNKCIFTA
jgi:hypothetical protein